MTGLILVDDRDYAQWVFDPTHPTQGRRFTLGAQMIRAAAGADQIPGYEASPRPATRDELLMVHTPEYVDFVLSDHECDEWSGKRPDMAALASLFVGGTLQAFHHLDTTGFLTAVHLPGAKHHAMAGHSSGFCVFNDFAITAKRAVGRGWKVAILDIDAHHGDGVEALLLDEPNVLTYSIHEDGIFPGTGERDLREKQAYNWPLWTGAGDRDLLAGVRDFISVSRAFGATMLFVTAGADGHVTDPLSSLRYTVDGYGAAARMVRRAFPTTPILMGGAGGYQPDAATPLVWAAVARGLVGEP